LQKPWLQRSKNVFGETPNTARETRALPQNCYLKDYKKLSFELAFDWEDRFLSAIYLEEKTVETVEDFRWLRSPR
jgi:hypothetical protein